MKEVTKYESADGRLFDTKEECEKHELENVILVKVCEEYGSHPEPEWVIEYILKHYNIEEKDFVSVPPPPPPSIPDDDEIPF